jgi:ubiquinol-cytochrome c reductase cytochrome b subunit
MGIVLGLSLTGYLLPWDQKGFFATQVATNIAGNLPGIGPFIQKVVVGGPEYGHTTLTHFYALHVGVFPLLMIVLIVAHLAVFRRHGVTAPANAKGEDYFWPAQAFRDMVMCMVIFGIMLGLVVFGGHGHQIEAAPEPQNLYEKVAKAGQQGLGANLDAPADPATESYPARPEWYFLFLFQLLKYFEGEQELIGTVVIPNAVLFLLILLPLFGIGRLRKFGHFIGVIVVVALLAAVGWLTYEAIQDDKRNAKLQEDMKTAEKEGRRAVQLAYANRIPEEGGKYLLRRDPQRIGPKLFEQNCATCHVPKKDYKPGDKDKAPDLEGFGTVDWNRRFLRNPGADDFFGRTNFKWMKEFMEEDFPHIGLSDDEAKKLTDEEREARAKDLKDIETLATWLARHPRKTINDKEFQKGLAVFKERGCIGCHAYEGQGGGKAKRGPELTGYGDAEWLRLMIMAPNHPSRYCKRNTMFLFRDFQDRNTEKITRAEIQLVKDTLLAAIDADDPKADQKAKEIEDAHRLYHLSDLDRELIIRWMTGDERVIFSGDMVSEPLKR